MAATHLLRIRNLRTNFYTYQGVVKALDGIDLDMAKGETLGLVGETGCGKSVTALSILRLIPSPPGKVEDGEALFDVDDGELQQISELKDVVTKDFVFLFGKKSHYLTATLNAALLDEATGAVRGSSLKEEKKKEVLARFTKLRELLVRYDLLSKSPEGLRQIRGHQISMIFQEPMQALNPVYTVGDQISESVILHRRRWLARRVLLRMREETVRKRAVRRLREAFRGTSALPPGIDLKTPARSDFQHILDAVESGTKIPKELAEQVRELVRVEGFLAMERPGRSVYSRGLPRSIQFRTYVRECLHSGWHGADVLEELETSFTLQGRTQGGMPWSKAAFVGDTGLALTPAQGLGTDGLRKAVADAIKADTQSEFSWSPLGDILEPPKVEGERLVLRVKKEFVKARKPMEERLVSRIPYFRKQTPFPQKIQAQDEAAEILRLLKIPDPQRVVNSYPHELSGGMNQRALIAIALSCNPLLLIADEPTTALDVTIQAQILELLKTLKESGRPSILIITHDLGVIADICDRVCVMYGGVIVEDAPVREIFKDPKHPYTKGLLRAIPSHAVKKESLDTIPGSVPNLIYPPGGCRFHPRCPVAMPTCGWDSKDLEERIKLEAAKLRLEDAVAVYERASPTRLEVTFVEGGASPEAMKKIQSFVDAGRAESVLFRAITKVETKNNVLAFTLDEGRKPDAIEVSARHRVSCLRYGDGSGVA